MYIDNVPSGTVVMWTKPTIPVGWVICDGNNNTPNLVNNFVMGTSPTNTGQPLNNPGGSTQINLSPANMPVNWPTLTDPGHGHISHVKLNYTKVSGGAGIPNDGTQAYVFKGDAQGHFSTGVDVGANTTGITVSQGGGQAVTHVPPYIALYYIMKV